MSFDIALGAFLEGAFKTVTTFPADIVFAYNQRSGSSDADIFKQQALNSDLGFAINLPGNSATTNAVWRNAGGSGGYFFGIPSSRNLNTWKWVRLRLTGPSSHRLDVGSSLNATDTTTIANDLANQNNTTIGCTHWAGGSPNNFYDGLFAELGVFDGGSISDADFAAVQAGTKFLENIAGVTTSMSCLTLPTGSTVTASDGKVFTLNGAITQGASHPVSRTVPPVNLVVAAMTGSRTMSTGAVSYAPPQAGVTNLAGSPMTGSRTMSSGAISYAPPVIKVTTDAFTAYGSAEPLVGLVVPHTEVVALDGSTAFHITNAVTDGLGRLVLPGALTAGADYAVASWDATGANVGCKIYRAA